MKGYQVDYKNDSQMLIFVGDQVLLRQKLDEETTAEEFIECVRKVMHVAGYSSKVIEEYLGEE